MSFLIYCTQAEWPSDAPMRHLYAGGDKLHFGPKKALPFTVYNVYGPAECGILTSCYKALMHEDSPPIGKPVYNVEVFVLDRNMEPVPIGVPGELCIAGAGVTRGYFNRDSLTEEKFVPCITDPKRKMYRTGDLVKYRKDGNIDFIGRIDFQVKIRGNRVELGEIESACLESGCCKEACVVAVNHDTSHGSTKVLAAYVVPFNGSEIDLTALRTYLAGRLPDYEMPAGFTVMNALPLTANGKVDKKVLPPPNLSLVDSQGSKDVPVVLPRTPIEKQLAEIWASVLGVTVEHVSVYDNFFEVGGHSMAAASLISLVNGQFNVNLRLFKIFQSPTVAGIASMIDEKLYGSKPRAGMVK
jgi:acyl carrier protein